MGGRDAGDDGGIQERQHRFHAVIPAVFRPNSSKKQQQQQIAEQAEQGAQPATAPRTSSLAHPAAGPSSQRQRPEAAEASFDVRTILGYGSAPAATVAASSSGQSTVRSAQTVTPTSIPYASSSSSSLEPWAAPSSSSTVTSPAMTTTRSPSSQSLNRFAYPTLRRAPTHTSSHSAHRQSTTDSITSSLMTADQSGQGFAPRTALGESYYMTLPPALPPASSQQAFPWALSPPTLPPMGLPQSSSAPVSPLNQARPPGVLGPRPPADVGPPRPVKSLSQMAMPQAQPGLPLLHQSVPTLSPPPPIAEPVPSVASLSLISPPAGAGSTTLPSVDADGGGSRLEAHATQLLTLGRQQYPLHPPAGFPDTAPPTPPAQEFPTASMPALPSRPPRPQRSATEEEEAQLAWAIEASKKDMEELERKAAAASSSAPRPPGSRPRPGPRPGPGPASAAQQKRSLSTIIQAPEQLAYTEGGMPLRTVVLPSRVLSIFLALARENTEKNIETCALLMGRLQTSSGSGSGDGETSSSGERDSRFVITHLTVPAQSGSSDRCETHAEEHIWEFQEAHDLVTVGWIHTHPSQSAFLSSLDLHTHCSFQAMTPEAIAIVCAPRHEPHFGLFRLTDPHGVQTILRCREPGTFHPHVTSEGWDIPALYTDALHGHVRLDSEARLIVVDLR